MPAPNHGQRIPVSDFDRALGDRIRSARKAAGLSQSRLGEALGITHQQIQKYESGQDRITAAALQRIAGAVGVHPGTFFDED